jgi:hypothetical protein
LKYSRRRGRRATGDALAEQMNQARLECAA